MNLVVISLFVVAGIIAFLFMSFNLSAGHGGSHISSDNNGDVNKTPPASSAEVKKMTRAEILNKLTDLKNSNTPAKLSPGAMCYMVAAPPERAEYVCPNCGEKTIYPKDKENTDITSFIAFHLPACRRYISDIRKNGIDAELDESSFCSKCSKGESTPELALVVKYPDLEKTQRTSPVSSDDLLILSEFAQNKKTHDGGAGGEKPLKIYIDKIQKLLGVNLDK